MLSCSGYKSLYFWYKRLFKIFQLVKKIFVFRLTLQYHEYYPKVHIFPLFPRITSRNVFQRIFLAILDENGKVRIVSKDCSYKAKLTFPSFI